MASWNKFGRLVAGACLLGLVAAPAVVSAHPADERVVAQRSADPAAQEAPAGARQLPLGFSDTRVGGITQPTGMAWAPDGRMLVISKPGQLVVMEEGQPNQVALDLRSRICSEIELGLLGIAVDPDFAENRFVYLYYSRDRGGACGDAGPRQPANQVGRFVLPDTNVVDPASETVIVGNIISGRAHHVAGDLEFGADGFLYISVGDGVCGARNGRLCGTANPNPQDRSVPQGKILRVGRAGKPAATNPYAANAGARRCTDPAGIPPGTGPCKEIFAMGFRNPFRFARKPGTSTFFVNDVGDQTWEEIDLLAKGRNYGWNKREGFCARASTTDCGKVPGFTNPLHAYPHTAGCRSITGGAFVPSGLWPGFENAYIFADYACGKLWRLDRRADGTYRRQPFSSGLSGPTHVRFGPHGDSSALYYLSIFDNEVRRIARSTTNGQPTAAFDYSPDGNELSFSGAGSRDGDQGDRVVSWTWDFGDGTPVVESTGPRVTHTYADAGTYTATLTVTDSNGLASEPVSRTVYAGEHPPTISFAAPAADAVFRVGQPFEVRANVSDPEDGTVPPSQISWLIKRQHDNHVHPFLGPVTGSSVAGTYPEAESLAAAPGSRLLVEVTAVDSRGHTTTATRTLEPRKVTLSFVTRPRGGSVFVEGEQVRTRHNVVSWVGHSFRVRVPDQRIDGKRYVFAGWSDGKPRRHDIVSPGTPTTYVARFRRP